jgi:uncharacterized protein YbcI
VWLSGRDLPPTLQLNQAIANAVVSAHHAHVGRGPSSARAFYHQDMLVVAMRNGFGPSERLLIADGQHEAVHEMRRHLHQAMRPELVEAVESLTGLRVEAALSAIHIDPDLVVQMFVLDSSLTNEPDS